MIGFQQKLCKKLSYLQTEFIEQHTEINDGVYRVTYSDGSIITVDYNNETYLLEKQ